MQRLVDEDSTRLAVTAATAVNTPFGVVVPTPVAWAAPSRRSLASLNIISRSLVPGMGTVLFRRNMVSEGVDIPRLMVGVYATSSRTDLFFRQAVGRFVRVRGDETDSCAATLFVPSVKRLLELARDLEIERDHVLNEDGEPRERVLPASRRITAS